jgi:hypothetical protein
MDAPPLPNENNRAEATTVYISPELLMNLPSLWFYGVTNPNRMADELLSRFS